MSFKHGWLFVAFACAAFAPTTGAEPVPAEPGAEWSETSNGLRARLSMRRSSVSNGTGIVTTYLELNNVDDVMNPLLVSGQDLEFHVTDADGREVPCSELPYDGPVLGPLDLVLPHDSTLRFRIGSPGFGIPADHAALLDLGPRYGWALPMDGKRYDLRAVLEIPAVKDDRGGSAIRWHGRLELPRVRIPTEPEPSDPATLGALIDDLGRRMLATSGSDSKRAARELSLIDDPRVVPWYVKEIKSRDYSRKFRALDRLARFPGDDALAGLEIGMATQGTDIANSATPALASTLAENVRHVAALALTRSPHPRAMPLLWTMEKDPARAVRVTVVQAAGRADTPESLELLERATHDGDATVRGEAERLLAARRTAPAK
jgi:hypothetical protein